MDSTVFELTQFLKFPKIFGPNMVLQLEFSRWANVLMGIQLMLDHIKTILLVCLITQCIILFKMFSEAAKQWLRLRQDMMQRDHILKTLMHSESLLTITTTLDSFITFQVKMLSYAALLYSL